MITNIDLFNLLVLTFLFNTGLIFMIIGYFTSFPKNLVFHLISAIMFLDLGVWIPVTGTQYYAIGWAFIMVGIICFFSAMIEGIGSYIEVFRREPWEREEWEE